MSKIVLITGTSSGFGKDTALTLKAAGHRVFGTMRGINGKHAEVARELQAKGIELIELDVTDDASVDAAFKSLFERTDGKLDVLVNNAGRMVQGVSEAVTTEQTRQMFDVNVLGIQRVLRATLPQLRKNGSGLVINIGSILGRVTIPFLGLYGATKFAVEAMTDSYRYELSQLGIDVVLVQPSAYPTSLYEEIGASDVSREHEYGAVADVSKAFNTYISGLLSGPDAPNSHDVAEEIARLTVTPAGQRPARVVVGNGFGADAINAAVAPIQSGMINAIGMAALETLKVA
ncbi:SDR family oxidoreductase [Rhizobium sp. BK376]|uniref:SDR family oxidoreductase n=1 Tax=Rhizobium sp. BK376 TaxID=2512149 RepID=UPI00104AC6DE|nr:SDR family oxidoreductase [Rhizobium sp. BK376]TCR93294.1 NADP-dependent 3-hydroxy acid dehydrogenase YdfG [Rhizobium sp. BK376]